MLKSINRLKKRKEFSFVYKKGKSFHTKSLSLFVVGTRLKNSKVGFSVSNKVGNSVCRHKIKRQMSEIVLKELSKLPLNNYVFIAKVGAEQLKFEDLKIQMKTLFDKVENNEE
jgi:ribonuclease P protein component